MSGMQAEMCKGHLDLEVRERFTVKDNLVNEDLGVSTR